MADDEQLARLKTSVAESNACAAWNQWRKDDWDREGRRYRTVIDFDGAHLGGAHLSDANLRGAHLWGADLSDADLRGADLWGADLSGANLRGANLSRADLSRANFRSAHLSRADLTDAHLRDADLTHAELTNANLSRADLTRAHFTRADLSRADLTRVHLTGADFTEVSIWGARLDDLDLRSIIGLAAVKHLGPSTVGTNTLYTSHGEIPDVFLRGCGLPDEMIGFVHSIAGAIQYYSAFISYNHADEAFATRLYNDLQASNVRCWKYTEDVKIGNDILARVDEAIRLHEKLVVIFSEHSVQSDWVAAEVEAALAREQREGKEILFPVTIDDAVKHTHFGWAAKIRRQRNIGDFTSWKDQDQYQPMFNRLLRDLKADSR